MSDKAEGGRTPPDHRSRFRDHAFRAGERARKRLHSIVERDERAQLHDLRFGVVPLALGVESGVHFFRIEIQLARVGERPLSPPR